MLPIIIKTFVRFLPPMSRLPEYFEPSKRHLMESFYRKMRVQLDVLMQEGKPERASGTTTKITALFPYDVLAILERLARHKVHIIRRASDHLLWQVA